MKNHLNNTAWYKNDTGCKHYDKKEWYSLSQALSETPIYLI